MVFFLFFCSDLPVSRTEKGAPKSAVAFGGAFSVFVVSIATGSRADWSEKKLLGAQLFVGVTLCRHTL